MKRETLVEILGKYPTTDKLVIGFGEFYEELFSPIRFEVTDLLEIGIFKGDSIRAWRDYFPCADIYALDNNSEFVLGLDSEAKIQATILDSGDRELLSSFCCDKYFDIVIDDGSHINVDVITAFDVLWPRLRSGGYYVVENTVVSYRDEYWKSIHPRTMDYFNGLTTSVAHNQTDIEYISFRADMIVLRKK